MRTYVDSDVLIWHLRGESRAANFLRDLDASGAELWTGVLQRAEIVFFMRPKEEEATMRLLSRFRTAPLTAEVVDEAGILYRKWSPSHGVDANDAFLAATAMRTGGRILTLNRKHYPMPDLVVVKAW